MTRLTGICCVAVLVAVAVPGAAQTADLGIIKDNLSLCPSPCHGPGGNIYYQIDVGNRGPDPAANVTLSDPLPANTTFVSLQVFQPGWACTTPAVGTTGTVTCTISSLGSGTSSDLQLTVNINASTPGGSVISNTASVTSTTTDPNPANNADTNLTQLFTLPARVPMLDARALAMFVAGLAFVGVLVLRRR